MTGAGTQADPYIVATLSDFFAMDDLESYYKLGADIDFADYEFTNTVTLKFLELDGDNHEIRNIYCPSDTPLGVRGCDRVINTKFVNCSAYNLFYSPNYPLEFTSCVFNVALRKKMIYGSYSSTYDSCTFNVSMPNCTNANGINIITGSMTNCNIFIDVVLQGNPITSYRYLLLCSTNDVSANCTIQGKIKDETESTGTLYLFSSPIKGTACNLTVEGVVNFGLSYENSTKTSTINTDLIDEGTEIILKTNHYAVTDEQAKSAGYLNSIGFTCYEGD